MQTGTHEIQQAVSSDIGVVDKGFNRVLNLYIFCCIVLGFASIILGSSLLLPFSAFLYQACLAAGKKPHALLHGLLTTVKLFLIYVFLIFFFKPDVFEITDIQTAVPLIGSIFIVGFYLIPSVRKFFWNKIRHRIQKEIAENKEGPIKLKFLRCLIVILSLLVSMLLFFSIFQFTGCPSGEVQFGIMLFFPFYFFAVFLSMLVTAARTPVESFICEVMLMFFFFSGSGIFLGKTVKNQLFHRLKPVLTEEIRKESNKHTVFDPDSWERLSPVNYKGNEIVYLTKIRRFEAENLEMIFYIGSAFPYRHYAILFNSTDKLVPHFDKYNWEWKNGWRIESCWFYVSD